MTSDLSQAIQELPHAGAIPLALLVILGLMLWAAGSRVMRAGFAALGLLLGGAAGWVAGVSLHLDGVPAWATAAVGGVLLACLAVLIFRVAIAGALGIVLAVASGAGVVTVHEIQQQRGEAPADAPQVIGESDPAELPGIDEANRWLFPDIIPAEGEADAPPSTIQRLGPAAGLSEATTDKLATAESYVERLLAAARAEWNATPEALRTLIIGAAIGGLLIGLLLGTLAPTASTTIVSAFGGSLLWLGGTRLLLLQASPETAALLPETASVTLLLWILIALGGVAIQWIFRPKEADKST